MTTLAALSLHFPLIWYGFLLLFGLALGSFYNVVIYRLPRMLAQTADDEPLTLSTPGSSCPQCRQPIAWRDNIPLLSFLWLGRRARCCQARISWSYPLTELTTGLLFLASMFFAPIFTAIPSFATAPALMMVGYLMVSTVTEIRFDEDNMAEAIPAYLAIVAMPLFYSISEGIAIGVISWTLVNVLTGKAKENKISPLMYVLTVLFILKYIFL